MNINCFELIYVDEALTAQSVSKHVDLSSREEILEELLSEYEFKKCFTFSYYDIHHFIIR